MANQVNFFIYCPQDIVKKILRTLSFKEIQTIIRVSKAAHGLSQCIISESYLVDPNSLSLKNCFLFSQSLYLDLSESFETVFIETQRVVNRILQEFKKKFVEYQFQAKSFYGQFLECSDLLNHEVYNPWIVDQIAERIKDPFPDVPLIKALCSFKVKVSVLHFLVDAQSENILKGIFSTTPPYADGVLFKAILFKYKHKYVRKISEIYRSKITNTEFRICNELLLQKEKTSL